MSNYLAIAAVTATLRSVLENAIDSSIIDGVKLEISTESPKMVEENKARINVFLYEVTPNTALRNMDLPMRRADGTLRRRPQVALDLFYLLSFYGSEKKLVPQRLLGRAVSVLHSQPILTAKEIHDALEQNDDLAASDLADQVERVKLTPVPLNLEERSKLWSMLAQNTQYALSVVYRASAVLIEEELMPTPALPVREVKSIVIPFREPVIESISPTIITANSLLTIKGQNLSAKAVRVAFAGLPTPTRPEQVSNEQMRVKLPKGLRAGVNSVQVVHEVDFGTGSTPDLHRGFESNVVPFVLRPKIMSVNLKDLIASWTHLHLDRFMAKIILKIDLKATNKQRVTLLLNHLGDPTTAYTFNAPPDNGITEGNETDTIVFEIKNVKSGNYLVRVQVDGAVSVLERDQSGKFSGPKVSIS